MSQHYVTTYSFSHPYSSSPRNLHSFPTRRSSDLLNDDADYELTNDLFTLDLMTNEITKLTNGKGGYYGARFSPNGEDRKSTRLNSSHVAISYAVFCLKKKNIQY